jgi:hypothetical protein
MKALEQIVVGYVTALATALISKIAVDQINPVLVADGFAGTLLVEFRVWSKGDGHGVTLDYVQLWRRLF